MANLTHYFTKNTLSFCPWLMPGYPDEETFFDLVDFFVAQGVQLFEMQIPFSDPAADGPILTTVHGEILAQGMTLEKALSLIAAVKKKYPNVGICIMSYANSVYHYGYKNFVGFMKDTAIDALLIPDIPIEENSFFIENQEVAASVASVRLVADNLSDAKIQEIAAQTSGFLYLISTVGTTGGSIKYQQLGNFITRVRNLVGPEKKLVVGFGIKTKEDVAFLKTTQADGFIIATEIIRKIKAEGSEGVKTYVQGLEI